MKIDVTQIEGYADLTAEEKVSLLENFEYNDQSETVKKYKASIDKLTHENAEAKKALNAANAKNTEQMSESERALASLTEQVKAIQEENAKLVKQNQIDGFTAQFVALGYSHELARETAQAQVDGDTIKVIENQKRFLDDYGKNLKAEMLKGTPAPGTGGKGPGGDEMTKEKFLKLGFNEQMKFKQENPNWKDILK